MTISGLQLARPCDVLSVNRRKRLIRRGPPSIPSALTSARRTVNCGCDLVSRRTAAAPSDDCYCDAHAQGYPTGRREVDAAAHCHRIVGDRDLLMMDGSGRMGAVDASRELAARRYFRAVPYPPCDGG
jgi:hypothetical protein